MVCKHCGKEFEKKSYQQVFCCNECKVTYHNKKQRGKRNKYFRKYNKKHPERIMRILPTLTARDRDEAFAMEQYLTDEHFRDYITEGSLHDEGGGCHVELYTEWCNYMGID